jgi:DNA-binding beta-propeller fold protein YncE
MVETVLGIPGTPGWKDGGKKDALFQNPSGIAVKSDGTVYVADYGNCRVRKLSIN